jgi:proline iminopeptidase
MPRKARAPAFRERLGQALRKRPIVAFLTLVLAISGAFLGLTQVVSGADTPEQFPGALLWLPIVWSPNIAALLVLGARGEGRDLLVRFRRFRLPLSVWLGASSPLAVAALVAVFLSDSLTPDWQALSPAAVILLLALHLVLGPLGEEGGWRGFLQPALDARLGRARAALVVGLVWASWHLPLWAFDTPHSHIPFPLFFAHVIAYGFALSALVYRAGGSVVPAVLFHWMVNVTTALAEILGLARAEVWFAWTLPFYVALAIALWGALKVPSARESSAVFWRRATLGVLASAAGAGAGLLWATAFARPHVPPVRDQLGRLVPGHVAHIEYPDIGGVPQAVVLRGLSESLPLVLFVHGGPGTPETPMLLELVPELSEVAVLASWEQRGAGKSFARSKPAPETLSIDQMTRDLLEVTEWLLHRYQRERLVLMAHSWGTVLAMHAMDQHPERYTAYVAIGQVADPVASEAAIYEWALAEARARGDDEALRDIEDIGPPRGGDYEDGVEGRMRLGRWIVRWGGALSGRSDLWPLIGAVLRSPVYGLGEKVAYLRGEAFSLSHLWHEMQTHDLPRAVRRVDVPLYFVHGRHDRQTPLEQARSYFEAIEAPLKAMFVFERSAHSPLFEEPGRFVSLLRDEILPAISASEAEAHLGLR